MGPSTGVHVSSNTSGTSLQRASAITELRETGPPTKTTGGGALRSAQSGRGSPTSSSDGRLSTTPSAPSSLSSSMRMTARSKLGSLSSGVATSRRPFVPATVLVYLVEQHGTPLTPGVAWNSHAPRTLPERVFGAFARVHTRKECRPWLI